MYNGRCIGGLQYHEGVRAMWLAEKAGNLYHHPYDLGFYHNTVSVRTISIISLLHMP
jgi:palmitoyltransferase